MTLTLEAESERDGAVALWAAPTLTGGRSTEKPNVIFYIIDGGAADYMSVYGYNRAPPRISSGWRPRARSSSTPTATRLGRDRPRPRS